MPPKVFHVFNKANLNEWNSNAIYMKYCEFLTTSLKEPYNIMRLDLIKP